MTTDTEQSIDLTAYQGKKVIFQLIDGASDLEGTVDTANETAMLFKPKGAIMGRIIEKKDIDLQTFRQLVEQPRELKSRRMDPVSLSNARNHLLDRHGFELAAINAMTDEQAYNDHAEIDHDRLGHFHAASE